MGESRGSGMGGKEGRRKDGVIGVGGREREEGRSKKEGKKRRRKREKEDWFMDKKGGKQILGLDGEREEEMRMEVKGRRMRKTRKVRKRKRRRVEMGVIWVLE